jgi:hypothetical protein
MLAGEAVVAIWNDIPDETRAQFYDWHNIEHMPERVGIPGFRRGRRYVAMDAATRPEFFTLYELDTMQVAQGMDYANRLNDPTPATRHVTSRFQNTFRALSRVLVSHGPGAGGVLLTIRFGCDEQHIPGLKALVRAAGQAARVTGAHFCQGDAAASTVRTTEYQGRTDVQAPPDCFIMIEATDAEALSQIMLDRAMTGAGATGPYERGVYRLEYTRTKTGFAP